MANKLTLWSLLLTCCIKSIETKSQAVNIGDSMVLVDIYNSTQGSVWGNNMLWFQGPISNWRGVGLTTDRTRVRAINLYNSNLNGTLPASLSNLTMCEDLDLSSNDHLTGQLPFTLGNMTGLRKLDLARCRLSGNIPANLGTLPNLERLDLSSNRLSGQIPATLGSNPKLKSLFLQWNKFTFDGMESLVQKGIQNLSYSPQDTILQVGRRTDTLYVSAGGTLQNNSYLWYAGGNPPIIVGDSTFVSPVTATYRAYVTNRIAKDLTLSSSEAYTSPVAAFDPNPSWIATDGSISSFIGNLDYSKAILKAATDGVTKLVLVVISTKPVTFKLMGDKTGMLSSLNSQALFSKQITVTPDYLRRAVVIYTVPDGYGKDNYDNKEAYVIASDDAQVIGTGRIQLVKPPVVLVHGMWSNANVWKSGGFVKALRTAGFTDIYLADYAEHSAKTFNPKSPESIHGRKAVADAVAEALWWCRERRIAATQVDVVGHSLGGLMTRSWSQQAGFKRADNFQKGYVHKLITLGTPHRGSPLGPELAASRNNLFQFRGDTLPVIPLWLPLALLEMPIGSCHADFGVSSPGITALEATPPYLTYSIVGDQTGQILGYLAFTLFSHIALNKSYADIFKATSPCTNRLDHDLVVPLSSQKGYISASQTFPVTGHSAPAFTTETNSLFIQAKVINLLLSDDATEFSTGFPAPSTFPLDCTTANQRLSSDTTNQLRTLNTLAVQPSTRAIQILSPISGTTLSSDSGSTIKLQYQTLNGAHIDDCIFLVQNLGWYAIKDSGDRSVIVSLPAGFTAGKLTVFALAKDSSGTTLGDSVTITVLPSGTLDSIAVVPTVRLDSSIREKPLSIRGYYRNAQGVITEADISHSSAGTTYQPQLGGIFSVSNNGLLSAKQGGSDTLIVSNNGKTAKVAISVSNTIYFSSYYSNAISFPSIPDKLVGDLRFALDASTASGERVKYNLVSGPATVTNGVVRLTGSVGTVVIKASLPKTTYFDSASNVTRSFMVLTSVVYTFNGSGSWSVASNWAGGQIPPAGLGSGATIFINPAENGECVVNSSQIIPSGVNLLIGAGKKIRVAGKLEIQ